MTNEELNTKVYEKLYAEQEKYKGWLLTQPPEEILNHAYEYTVREDIVLAMEYHDISDEQAKALLSSPAPLDEIFHDFEQIEGDHMDVIRGCIETRANDILEEQRLALLQLPVYKETAAYARDHGELDQWRASHRANTSCRDAIEDAIAANYKDNRLNMACLKDVLDRFGLERTVYACEPRTADAEFLASKKRYEQITGRCEATNVIAYQVRQSFKPGEVSPEEANQIGYDFAMRFLKGKHAFIVCTHTDKKHIHNHIYWNSTTLDCTRKFRDFHRSGKAVRTLSDLICTEHKLSVIADPQRHGDSYNKWLGNRAKVSHRERLRMAIDTALSKKPHDFNAFLALLSAEGYRAKRGKHLAFEHDDFKQKVRINSLGEGYSEDEIRAVVQGQRSHTSKKRRIVKQADKPQTIIDIQAKLAEGKGDAYRRWATVENLKRMAKTKLYMDEHHLDYESLAERKDALVKKEADLTARITQAQTRLAEINVLKTHIVNYSKTKDIYVAYRKSGYSKKYLEEHEADIIIHKAAKKAFDELGVKKLPTVKSLQVEFAELLSAKKTAYADLKKVRDEMRELSIHKANYEELRDLEEREDRKEQERGRE